MAKIPMYGQNKDGNALASLADSKRVYDFSAPPVIVDDGIYGGTYAVPDGTADAITVHQYRDGLQLCCAYMGTCTDDGPAIAATGMNYENADTGNLGFQWVMKHPGSKGSENLDQFTIGQAAFYAKLEFSLADVSEADYCWFGFRLASQAAVAEPRANATDYAVIGPNAGNISVETALNNTTASVLDTTDDWANGAVHTMEVRVAKSGAATFKIDGQDPTINTTTLTFDAGDVVTPWFVYMKSGSSAAACILRRLEVGLLSDKGNN